MGKTRAATENHLPLLPPNPDSGGIRVTTRGFGEKECVELAGWMCDVIDAKGDQAAVDAAKAKVLDVCAKFPVYKG